MNSQEIRRSFIDFFVQRHGHTFVPSSSVIPWDDPTLLFTNAGMNQFKDVFLGTGTRSYTRAVNAQKCIRAGGKHNDLEDVGKSPSHQTFFEMLGNWSFGDYYKREAIVWGWELLTEVWNLPKNRLWASVFREDDEAEELWATQTDIGRDRIMRFGEKDNFWEMGETGPCGPCSEIHIDLGPEQCRMQDTPHRCEVNGDCGRYLEIWNLVFIQYNRDASGRLSVLPAKHVDTGMGFERIVSTLSGVSSNYDTDIFRPLIDRIGELSGRSYSEEEMALAFRVVADHIRALTFAIADGALPSNEGRGYVLRRILRRAARYSRTLGQTEPFMHRLVPVVVDKMGDAYPEIRQNRDHVSRVIQSEEVAFGRTLDRGLEHFESLVSIAAGESRRHLTGVETFKLYDTYGFPADLTRLMAEERNMTVDMAGFEREMEQQRNRSRAGAATVDMSETAAPETRKISGTHSEFVGYDVFETEGAVVVTVLDTGVVLSRTPFYAESGGQIGDTGWLVSEEGAEYRIVDTVKRDGGILHKLDPQDMRPLLPGTQVAARIDTERRRAIMRNHTATHLLHAALRNVLGTHVHQRGSEVADDRLRFDFTHFSSVAPEELDTVERTVNENIWANAQVQWFETDLEEARNMGAMALFTEKYGDRVRVVRIGDVSLELCGGSHLRATGEIGLFRIVRESGIAAGERRIEALTGEAAYRAIKHDTRTLDEVAALLKTDPGEVTRRAGALNDRIRELEREVRRLQSESARNWLDDILAKTVMIGDITVAASRVDCPDTDALRAMGDAVRARLPGEAVGALFSVIGERPVCIAVVTDAGISNRGLHAGTLARDIAAIMGGGGGGKAHMAQAGGKDISSMDAALSRVPEVVSTHLQQG